MFHFPENTNVKFVLTISSSMKNIIMKAYLIVLVYHDMLHLLF